MKPSIVVLPLLILNEFEKTITRILCAESGRLGCSNERFLPMATGEDSGR